MWWKVSVTVETTQGESSGHGMLQWRVHKETVVGSKDRIRIFTGVHLKEGELSEGQILLV